MIKIIFYSDFLDSENLKTIFYDVFCKGKNNYLDKIEFTSNEKEATHAIVLNKTICPIKLPKNNILGLAFEPSEVLNFDEKYINYVKDNFNMYLIGDDNPIVSPSLISDKPIILSDYKYNFKNYYSFMWTTKNRDKYFENHKYEKKHIMSIILSKKNTLPGHIYRKELTLKILSSNLNIHIYGRGSEDLNKKNIILDNRKKIIIKKDKRIKGSFIDFDNIPYEEYYYTIAIENTQHDSYISEKFTQAISCNTIPIYWGGKKVDNYFGEKCCYKLTGDIEKDFKMIEDIYNNYKYKILDLKNARKNLYEDKAYFMKYINDLWL
jgi:hypothetical protein